MKVFNNSPIERKIVDLLSFLATYLVGIIILGIIFRLIDNYIGVGINNHYVVGVLALILSVLYFRRARK